MNVREIEAEALKLPREDRARLAEMLLASLADDELDPGWADEADRRFEELRSGAVRGIPAEEVFAQIRDRTLPDVTDPRPR